MVLGFNILYKMTDDFDAFMQSYLKNIKEISTLTMEKKLGEVDPDLLESNICWMVTDNMERLLSTEAKRVAKLEDTNDVDKVKEFLTLWLKPDYLLIIRQDEVAQGEHKELKVLGHDHWFAVVADQNGKVHIIEHTEEQCNATQTFNHTGDAIVHLLDVMRGVVPDRFYHKKAPHSYLVFVHKRRPMTADISHHTHT